MTPPRPPALGIYESRADYEKRLAAYREAIRIRPRHFVFGLCVATSVVIAVYFLVQP